MSCELPVGTLVGPGVHHAVCTLLGEDGVVTTGTHHVFVLPEGAVGGISTARFDVPDASLAAPSTIRVDAPGRVVTDVDVDLRLSHESFPDLDVLLVGPDGRSVVLMSDVACGTVGARNLRFDDEAEGDVPALAVLPPAGTYRPTNIDGCGALAVPFGAWATADGVLGDGAQGPTVRLDSVAPVLLGPEGTITVEAAPGEEGAVVDFEVTLAGAVRAAAVGDGPVACSPPAGSFFPIGTTRVECTATDDAGRPEPRPPARATPPRGTSTAGASRPGLSPPSRLRG